MSDSGDMFGTGAEEESAPSVAELEAAGQSAMFGGDAPVSLPTPPSALAGLAQPYRVLARKYRPQTFSELIGQEPMVRTLANAIKRDRLAHAFLMTGVRGVGKTSTARLIAKALNCIGPDGQGGPTIDPCGECEPCIAIAEGRHIDVIEMDAASHTGIDDVREIIEAVRYAAVSARYKIYIIDEAHMLSKQAWNGLLKTLEEPPGHVKFLFATTEVEKLLVTVLSRCQRFDLRRIPAELLAQHFASVCRQEGVVADDEALHLIAAAAEGSVRDGLSILDQAIAHADLDGEGRVTGERVREMLGLADRGAQRRLLGCLLEGDAQGLLAALADQYSLGVEPLSLMRALMDIINRIAVCQVGKNGADAPTQEERAAIEDWAARLSPGQVHRLWQLLIKGYEEVRTAPDALVAAQMALLRALHAADLPDPGTLAKRFEEIAERAAQVSAERAGSGCEAAPAAIDWGTLVSRLENEAGLHLLGSQMRMQVRPVEVSEGRLVYAQDKRFGEDLAPDIKQGLLELTGQRWQVERVSDGGAPTLVERAEADKAAAAAALRAHPLVEATFAAFPDARMLADDDIAGSAGAPPWRRNA